MRRNEFSLASFLVLLYSTVTLFFVIATVETEPGIETTRNGVVDDDCNIRDAIARITLITTAENISPVQRIAPRLPSAEFRARGVRSISLPRPSRYYHGNRMNHFYLNTFPLRI